MTVEFPRADDWRMDVSALLGAVRARALRLAVVTVLLLAVAFAVLLFVPRLYESSASLLVDDRGAGTGYAAPPVAIDAMVASQIALVQSRDTLLGVIDSENLRSLPEFNGSGSGPLAALGRLFGRNSTPAAVDETVLQNLSSRLDVYRERDSAVITIAVRSEDPQLAAKLANAIASEDVKRRAQQSLSDTTEAASWLQEQIDAVRAKAQDADARVADYKVANGIFTGSDDTSLNGQQLSDVQKQVTDAQERKNSAQQRAGLIRGLIKAGQPLDGVPDVRDSLVIQQLTQSKAAMQGDLAQREATLLPSHPSIKALKAQIAAINDQIKGEAIKIATSLEAQVKIESGTLDSLNEDMTRAKVSSSDETKDSVGLDSLERDAKAQRDLLDSYLLRYRDAASASGGSALPGVRVITEAAPAVTPVSPNIGLVLGAVAFFTLALQIGAILLGEVIATNDADTRAARHDEPEVEPEDLPLPEDIDMLEAADLDEWEEDEGLAEPQPEPVARRPSRRIAPAPIPDVFDLAADVATGRVQVVLLAALTHGRDAALVADTLASEALRRGLSVVRIDAGSGRASNRLGLSDLCAETASFGEIVHRVQRGLAEVPWGREAELKRRSSRPLMLIEALADIYEVVIVVTGRFSASSALPLFAGTKGRLVLVAEPGSPDVARAAADDLRSLGFDTAETVALPSEPQAAVA